MASPKKRREEEKRKEKNSKQKPRRLPAKNTSKDCVHQEQLRIKKQNHRQNDTKKTPTGHKG